MSNQLKGLKDKSKTAYNRYHYLLEVFENPKKNLIKKISLFFFNFKNLRQDNKFLLCLELEDSQDIIADVFDVCFKIIK